MKQPTIQNMINLFKENNYIEIGYIDDIKRFYQS